MSPSPGRTESVLGTCSCHVLCPEPQWHAPSLHYPSPPVGLCVCTHYLLGHITTRPGSLTSPGPQSSPRCLSVEVARSLALGRPDSGFPGNCEALLSRCLHPSQCTISSLPCLSPPLPARTQQGELFQAPWSGHRPTPRWEGQGPGVRPPRTQACQGTTAQPGPRRTGAPKAPLARLGVPILSAVGRALCFVEHLLAFFFPLFNVQAVKKVCLLSLAVCFGLLFSETALKGRKRLLFTAGMAGSEPRGGQRARDGCPRSVHRVNPWGLRDPGAHDARPGLSPPCMASKWPWPSVGQAHHVGIGHLFPTLSGSDLHASPSSVWHLDLK